MTPEMSLGYILPQNSHVLKWNKNPFLNMSKMTPSFITDKFHKFHKYIHFPFKVIEFKK